MPDRPIYLDYAASTPLDPLVLKAMLPCLQQSEGFGNPGSSSHVYGWEAAALVQQAREQVAHAIHADPKEIIWTSGATEANNLALQGYAYAHMERGKHIITSRTEHKSVLGVCEYLASRGFDITYLKPQLSGLIAEDDFVAAIRPDTILASIMLVNNEIGVIQNIARLAEIAEQQHIAFHTDAVQAAGKMPIDVKALGVDLLSLSAHKVYGPKGIGILYTRRKPRVKIEPLLYGGGQELGLRAGTLPTHQIVGMGEAMRIADEYLSHDCQRVLALKQRLWQKISQLPEVYLNGDPDQSVPHILNVSFAGVDGEALLMALQGLAVSSGSACNSASMEPSHVLRALAVSDQLAHSTIRFSLGRFTTAAEIDAAAELVCLHVSKLRSLSPLWRR